MTVITATATIECTLPAEQYRQEEHYEIFLAEQLQTRRRLELLGIRVIKWMGRTTFPTSGSIHTWLIECEESALTVLTLTCHNVKILES